MKVNIGISNRHVHLTKEDFVKLFGTDVEMKRVRDLTQTGEYASNLKVTLKTEKGIIEGVRVLGPLRSYTQVEISKTDAYKLGLNPPVRESGDLIGSENVTIIANNELLAKESCIIASRHIHISYEDLKRHNLDANKKYTVKVNGDKGGLLYNVSIKANDNYVFEMHIDTDDANAHLLSKGATGEIIGEYSEDESV